MTLGGLALTLADRPWILVPALALVTFGMFGGVTAAQLGLADAGRADRGVASAIYFSCYYGAGALAAVLPGLAWQEWAWPGVVAVTASALLAGSVALRVTR